MISAAAAEKRDLTFSAPSTPYPSYFELVINDLKDLFEPLEDAVCASKASKSTRRVKNASINLLSTCSLIFCALLISKKHDTIWAAAKLMWRWKVRKHS